MLLLPSLLLMAATRLLEFKAVESFTITQHPPPGVKSNYRDCFRQRSGQAVQCKLLFSASGDESNESQIDEGNNSIDYSNEETLLCIDLAVLPGVEWETARVKVSKFCQSFPFAAVLPVQPLHYVPVYEDGGVEVKFLRKKTARKSSVDGGIRFFLQPLTFSSHSSDDNGHTRMDQDDESDDGDDKEDNDDIGLKNDNEDRDAHVSSQRTSPPPIIQVTAKRNSQGQTIAKLFAEKLVVTSFVAGLTGTHPTTGQPSFGHAQAPLQHVQVRSLYHKWM